MNHHPHFRQAELAPLFEPPLHRPWYACYEHRHRLTVKPYERIKRVLDIGLCILALPCVLAAILLCAAAIKAESRGPVLFHQRRTGKGGRRFRMYKLRTMVANAHLLQEDMRHLSQLQYPDFKISHDPRTTRVGRFLRQTSLDELPQIFNILRGEMTLVGPRPTSFGPDAYQLWHGARLEVTPGLTGLWQVSGRNDLEFDERLRLDIAYIRNRCLTLDLLILLRTVGCVISRRGA